MVVGREGVLKGGPMEVFREGIGLVLNFWWEIRCFVHRELGGDPDPRLKLDQLRHSLFHWFIQSKVPPSVPSATMKLKELISFFEINLMDLDNSLEEVSEQLVVMYHECLQGNFSSVEIIQEANLRVARHLIRPNVVKGNLSLMDASGVFRQGIGLLMENLWVRHVFIHHLCHSNPHRMLQQLADDILFWFTQTIKPLSFAYIERILRNELYSLPIDYQVATDGITKEVASTLMLMHKECLQGNFSSIEILREESLNQDKGMPERIGVAPPAAAVPVVSEKSGVDDGDMRVDYSHRENREREKNYSKEIREEREKLRVARRKEREKERRLEAKDAAMGKKSKITRDRDHDISEELVLLYASTNKGTKVMYDEMLFNQDTGMSSGFATDDQYNVFDRPSLQSEEADSCSTSCNEKGIGE